jgi:hypothetical protein
VTVDDGLIERIQIALTDWKQGDTFCLSELAITHVADLRFPLTQGASALANDFKASDGGSVFHVVAQNPDRFLVVSQTCDIVKKVNKSEMVSLAPVFAVDKDIHNEAKKGRHSRYLYLPSLDANKQVANLELIFFAEKSVLLQVDAKEKICAVRDDHETTQLAMAIARKFNRFAFPDEFNQRFVYLCKEKIK